MILLLQQNVVNIDSGPGLLRRQFQLLQQYELLPQQLELSTTSITVVAVTSEIVSTIILVW